MTGARVVMAQTLLEGGDLEQADANNAYCQAKLKGPQKWLKLPMHLAG